MLTVWDDLTLGLSVMLCYRTFKRALTAPMLFHFELLLALQIIEAIKDEDDHEFRKFWLNKYGLVGLLATSHFLIHRGRVFLNKLVYILSLIHISEPTRPY